ncbi:MAG: hypothetical protein ACE5JE_02360 [Thermoplasmata archaeon]
MKRRYIVLIISSALLLSSLIFLPLETLGASTVVDLNAATATATEQSRKVFKNPRGLSNYYVFYLDDADTLIKYAYSSDGTGWTSGNAAALIALEMVTGDESSWATTIYDDGTQLHVYLVYHDDTNARLRYRHGTIADASATITWATEQPFGGYAQEAYGVSLAVSSNGRLFAAWSDERNAGLEVMRVFGWNVIPAGDTISGGHAGITESARLIVTTNPTGTANEINAVYQEGATILNAVKVTDTGGGPSFGTKSTLTGLSLTRAKVSAATDTEVSAKTHVAYRNGAAVVHRTYNEASGFSAPTTVHSAAPDSVSVAMDETSTPDKVFVFYVKSGVTGDLFFKTSFVDLISFGSENTISDGTEAIDYLSTGVKDWGGDSKIPVVFTTQTTFLVRFDEAADPAIVKAFRTGLPADDGEITEPATHLDRLDLTGAGPSCAEQAISPGNSIKAYDIKQAVTYATGDWTLILDWNLNNRDAFSARVVITNAVGAEQSTVVNFGSTIVTQGPSSDQTLTVNKATPTTLLATQRLAVFIINDMDETFSLRIGNFDTTCNTRLVTPNLVATGCDALTVATSDPAGELWFNETAEPDGIPFTTQTNVSASFQTGATPALSVTNDGSGTCDITIRLMSNPGTGRTMKFNTTNNAPWPTDNSREVPLSPSSVIVCSSVAPTGTCDIWLWADYENAVSGQSLADVRVETI